MLSVVLVDDVQEDLGFLERILRQCKILNPIHSLHSGEECVDFFKKTDAKASPSLVILDLIMSPLSGVATLRRLKSLGVAQNSVFVMLSGITDIRAINEGYQLGAHTFMIKPVNPEDLMQTLQGLRSKIHIERREDGYLLDWIAAPHLRGSTYLDPQISTSGVSLFA